MISVESIIASIGLDAENTLVSVNVSDNQFITTLAKEVKSTLVDMTSSDIDAFNADQNLQSELLAIKDFSDFKRIYNKWFPENTIELSAKSLA